MPLSKYELNLDWIKYYLDSDDSETLCSLLLYGSTDMNMIDNRIIIEATTEWIEKQTG